MRRLLAMIAIGGLVASTMASAQSPPPPTNAVVWSTFVGGPGRAPLRAELTEAPGTVELGDSPWRCGYARTRQAAISPDDWSVQRVLACQRDQATVSATASCRVRQGNVEEHAATLSLGTVGESRHITVTLSCRGR